MAVRLLTARNTFLSAVKEFPRWMSLRKRPEKAISGLFLQSIIEEQTDIVKELEKFIKEFFLITYMGKESEIADYVYIVQVGSVDYLTSELVKPVLDITIDPKVFLDNMSSYALYQGGYFIISADNLPSDSSLLYTYNDYKYGGKLQRYHIWNIFDEFAMFLGLSRFSDTGETNAQLLRRCFLVFSNPANSTRTGLQNTIMNCLSNEFTVEREDIKIESLDDNNVWFSYDDDTVYEHFVQLNKDIFRAKIWDSTWWEHKFKQLDYLSHVWDKQLDVYQDGTGQLQDLKVTLSKNYDDNTAVTVQGFKKDQVRINEYFRKQNIRGEIPLKLLKYRDTLNPRHVQYKITATPAVQIKTEEIQLREQVRTEGINFFYIQDIVSNAGYTTITNHGLLEAGKEYELVFKSDGDYSDMRINRIDLVDGGMVKNLMSATKIFTFNGNGLVHTDIKNHITRISELKSYDNLVDIIEGFTLSSVVNTATFTVDITGCGGKTLKISSYGNLFDAVEQTDRWVCNGLELRDHKLGSYTALADGGTATLDISCMGFSVKLLENTAAQGSVNVKVFVDGEINSTLSRLMTDPDAPLEHWFDRLTDVKIVFTKSGSYPFEAEVKTTKYEITYSTTVGSVVQGPVSSYLSDVPDNVPNTLTVTVKGYDVRPPVIRYVHIGPSTARTNYTVKNIKPVNDNAYLDIDTNCKVFLYEVVNGQKILISDNFVTKRAYKNNTDDDIYLEINLQRFSEITSSSWKIHKTTRYGKTVSYLVLHPDDEITSMTVTGVVYHERALRTLDTLLKLDVNYNVYIAEGADGFIVRNPTTGEEWITRINRSDLTEATVFSYENLPANVTGVFVVDRPNNVRITATSANRNFDDTFLTVSNSQQYIAYNEIDMYKSTLGEAENIEIVSSMFSPTLPANAMMYYQISAIENTDGFTATAVFKKLWKNKSNYFGISTDCRDSLINVLSMITNDASRSTIENAVSVINTAYNFRLSYSDTLYDDISELLSQGYWSLGRKEIFIATAFDFQNSESFSVDIDVISSVFALSSDIQLQRYFEANGVTLDLCSYIIVPPEYMKVEFSSEDDVIENGLIVKNDGFNKLQYSNIKEIQALVVNGITYTDYTLLPDEGIIVWNNIDNVADLAGSSFSIAYSYKVPTSLLYVNLSYLYDMVGYSIETLLPIELKTKLNESYQDNDVFTVEWQDSVDYVPAPVCSNPNFTATYSNGTVTVKQVYLDNVALVQAGYYYDENKEYYYYNHQYTKVIERYNNVTLHNVKKLDVIFQFMMASVNYIVHSDFNSGINYEKLCYVRFNDPFVKSQGISAFDEITACETYNMWRSYNMDVSFVTGLKDIGLLFTAEDVTGYAVMNITKYMIPEMLISVFATGGLTLEIYREMKADGDIMVKTVFAEPFDVFTVNNGFHGYLVPADINRSCQYYLVVKGSGILDDMISRQNVKIEDQMDLHVKNIESLGFVVSEREQKGTLLSLDFEKDGCILDSLEITKDNKIQIGSNVDYGVTRVFDSSKNYDDLTAADTVVRKKGTFITIDRSGWVKTPYFYLDNSTNVVDIYVKVNNLVHDNTKNFNVRLRTAASETGFNSRSLGYVQKTNLASFVGSQVGSYLQAEVEMSNNKIIDSVEIFARYGERDTAPLIIQDNFSGSVITKVYDTITVGSYRLKRIIGTFEHKSNITFFMRGCKQDNMYMVWTDWYIISLNADLEAVFTPHVFDEYRLFQFRLDFSSSNASATIERFILEVV